MNKMLQKIKSDKTVKSACRVNAHVTNSTAHWLIQKFLVDFDRLKGEKKFLSKKSNSRN